MSKQKHLPQPLEVKMMNGGTYMNSIIFLSGGFIGPLLYICHDNKCVRCIRERSFGRVGCMVVNKWEWYD